MLPAPPPCTPAGRRERTTGVIHTVPPQCCHFTGISGLRGCSASSGGVAVPRIVSVIDRLCGMNAFDPGSKRNTAGSKPSAVTSSIDGIPVPAGNITRMKPSGGDGALTSSRWKCPVLSVSPLCQWRSSCPYSSSTLAAERYVPSSARTTPLTPGRTPYVEQPPRNSAANIRYTFVVLSIRGTSHRHTHESRRCA